ncbi:adenosine deaminase [bacterium]|nr:adenosine deaminase [bacterium]MBU1071663.1 adenosine deaminase [bacterium]MBU1676401.1 adenosine deaminase [bacterium]
MPANSLQKPSVDLLRALPKTDLHVHLDGSLRPATVRELSARYGLPFDFRNDDDVRAVCQVGEQCESLEDYLKIFEITLQLMQRRDDIERISCELAEDAHRENVRYLEVRYSPMLHTDKGLTLDEVVAAVQAGLDRAHRRYGIISGQIICGIRHISPGSSLELAELAVRWKGRGVVAFDLAGAEKDFPAKDHLQAFYTVLNHNLPVTVHAGEAFGPASIHQAVHYCGANRIGHGTHLAEDPDLMQWVNDRRIALEVCLASNMQTRAISDWDAHPIRHFFDNGLRVTINTDNRLVSGTDMTHELELAVTHYDLTEEQITKIILDGFKSAFLPLARKARLIDRVLGECEALGIKVGGVIDSRWRAHV